MITETFSTLLRDRAHWEFEIFLMVLFDGLIAGIFWPFLRKHWKHHVARDKSDVIYGRSLFPSLMTSPSATNYDPEKWPWENSKPLDGYSIIWAGSAPDHLMSDPSAKTAKKP